MKKITIFLFVLFFNIMIVDASKFKVTLSSCIDGDTAKFNINGEVKTVRFLSINTPEIAHDDVEEEPYGTQASDFTCNALKNASVIKILYDPKSDSTDKYGRVLAWVFVDNELLQEKLVKNGLAEVKYVYDDYQYSSDLKEIEKKARAASVGIWSNVYVNNVSSTDLDFAFYVVVLFLLSIVSYFIKKIFSHK